MGLWDPALYSLVYSHTALDPQFLFEQLDSKACIEIITENVLWVSCIFH